MDSNDLQLDEFGEYLLKRSFCPERNVRFYVSWVRKYFKMIRSWPADAWDVLLQRFTNELRENDSYEDWQISQAEKAVRLYFHNFQNGDDVGPAKSPSLKIKSDGSVGVMDLLSALRERLRVQHYSYRSEQTYLDWIKRFIIYADSVQAAQTDEADEEKLSGDNGANKSKAGRPVEKAHKKDLPKRFICHSPAPERY